MSFLQTMALVPLWILAIFVVCLAVLGLVLNALVRENDRLREENEELYARLYKLKEDKLHE